MLPETKEGLSKLLNHNGKLSDYFVHGPIHCGWIIVVSEGVILTVHRNQSDEWQLQKPTA